MLTLLLLIVTIQLWHPVRAWTDNNQAGEYQVKAAYIYNFASFVTWPSETSATGLSPLTICILGKSPFKDTLSAFAGKSVRGRRVIITQISRIDELKDCDILVISNSEKTKQDQIFAAVAARPILTISDIKRFVQNGGMIGFVNVNDKVKFEINQRVALRSNLRVSAQLLKLATLVVE